jgi:hypothetical protein
VFDDIAPGIGKDHADFYWCQHRNNNDERFFYYHGWGWIWDEVVVKSESFLKDYRIGPRIPGAADLFDMQAKVADYDTLADDYEKQAEQLAKLHAGELTLEDIAIGNGCMRAEFSTKMGAIMAESFNEFLKEQDAKNYVEMQFTDKEGSMVTVTVQRHHGKTPHQLRVEAEAKLAALTNQV